MRTWADLTLDAALSMLKATKKEIKLDDECTANKRGSNDGNAVDGLDAELENEKSQADVNTSINMPQTDSTLSSAMTMQQTDMSTRRNTPQA